MEASGTWLKAGDVLAAADLCRLMIQSSRRHKQRAKALLLARSKWWRPWSYTYRFALKRVVDWQGYATGWWSGQDNRALLLRTQAAALDRDKLMFVSTKDFQAISDYYQTAED